MVFRRGLALLCIAAAVALADVSVDAKEHHKGHHNQVAAVKESKVEYPNGVVLISTKDDGKPADKKHEKHHERKHANRKHAKTAESDESSDDAAKRQHQHKKKAAPKSKKAEETTAANGEVTRKYAHGSVRISKQDSAAAATTAKGKQADAHMHKKEVTHKAHATTSKREHKHAKGASGEVTKDFELQEGVNKFTIEGVPLKVTVDNGKVDVSVNGQHVKTGSEITIEAPEVHTKEAAPVKKEHAKKEHSKKKEAAANKDAEVSVSATASKAKAVDAKAERVTELATKLSQSEHGFFSTETAPVVFICGIIGALAAVVGIAAVAMSRTRGHAAEDGNLQSVLDDSSELDIEAAVQDAPADQNDSLEDSESDNDDDDEAGEGTFANNERAGTVSV